ncbi:hypothetical protein [Phormidesmis sp. 146-33]
MPLPEELSVAALKGECHRLIEAIAYRPGAAKLLLGAKKMLTTFSQYKKGRWQKDRRSR